MNKMQNGKGKTKGTSVILRIIALYYFVVGFIVLSRGINADNPFVLFFLFLILIVYGFIALGMTFISSLVSEFIIISVIFVIPAYLFLVVILMGSELEMWHRVICWAFLLPVAFVLFCIPFLAAGTLHYVKVKGKKPWKIWGRKQETKNFCENCGNETDSGKKYCGVCGEKLNENA